MRRIPATLVSVLLVTACADEPTTSPDALEPAFSRASAAYALTTVEVPDALATLAWGIGASGDVVGTFVGDDFVQRGFVLRRGEFEIIEYPGAEGTDARALGPGGEIIGNYWLPGEPIVASHGFRLYKGEFSTIDYPGHLYTIAQRVTPNGTVLGCRHDHNTSTTMRGIAMGRDGNHETDAFASMHNGGTADGRITGFYMNTDLGRVESYLIDQGVMTTFMVPGSDMTQAWDMNAAGEIVGFYRLPGAVPNILGFVQSGANVATVAYPGATATRVLGINARGDIAGTYVLNGRTYGFIGQTSRGGAR